MLRVAIDAPPVRSLSANEKMVYRFLKEGLTPMEIAKRMKIPLGKNCFADNRYEVAAETVVNLISSIREKGWDIPTDKEEAEMAKITEDQKREIVQLAISGMPQRKIADKFGLSQPTVHRIVNEYEEYGESAFAASEIETAKKEPETAVTVSDPKQEIVSDVPADIIPQSDENVKPAEKSADIPDIVKRACLEYGVRLTAQMDRARADLCKLEKQLDEIRNFLREEEEMEDEHLTQR